GAGRTGGDREDEALPRSQEPARLRRTTHEEMTMGPSRTTPLERDPDRLDEALPWYLNGTLDEADRAWVEAALGEAAGGEGTDAAAGASALRRSLEFDRRTAESLQERLAQIPADVGWSGLVRKV